MLMTLDWITVKAICYKLYSQSLLVSFTCANNLSSLDICLSNFPEEPR